MIYIDKMNYEIIEDNKNAFNYNDFLNAFTEYFHEYDYIVCDITYNKLRLKGFCDEGNELHNNINDSKAISKYLKESIITSSTYYILKKVN